MPKLYDANGKQIKDGNNLERIIDSPAAYAGQKYRAEQYKWDETDDEESLVANAVYIKTRLNAENAKEFKII